MKRNKIFIILSALSLVLGFSACGDYLDKLPDDRASLDTQEKVAQFLVSAYPTHMPTYIFELASDNVTDNGTQYLFRDNQDKIYRFEDDTYTGNDDPYSLWNSHYTCVATANNALQALDEMGGSSAMPGEYSEALLCRAYAMFNLANIFCLSYNKDSADVYLGLPYPLKVEAPTTQYERGTLAELYGHINDDIEAALPLLDDTHLTTPKYHFNTNAAYAFAARFNLFYGNYDKAIQYASKVLGTNPSSMIRDFSALYGLAGVDDIQNAYLNSGVNANLMLQTAYSSAGRMLYSSSYRRFAHNRNKCYDVNWAWMPWAGESGTRYNTLWVSHMMYGSTYGVRFPKQDELFEYTDKVGGTGYAHIVVPVFTADETLLVRAEAEALSNDSASAVRDINYWINNHCTSSWTYSGRTWTRPTSLTMSDINAFYDDLPYEPVHLESDLQSSAKKQLHPQGFTVASGNQENLVQMILQMRRIDTLHDGSRLMDLKRYGISYEHVLDGENPIVIQPGDKRLAFQLPDDAINNGLAANPR